jgi:D-proline reductase (dithiol) PrdB
MCIIGPKAGLFVIGPREDALELKELLYNPGTVAFSRLKYLQRFASDEQIAEFLNGLFQSAANARFDGNWEIVGDYLEKWDDIGIGLQYETLAIPETGSVPWATLGKPLSESKVALVTTGGVFLEGQTPYTERGDTSYRELPKGLNNDDIRIWHPGYDTGPATKDINCIFPIDRFREMEAEGVIGEIAETNYAFMGLIPDPQELIESKAPEVARKLKEDGVDIVFMAST